MRVPERPARDLTEEQIQAFRRDGVICVRQLYSPDWVRRIAAFLDDIIAKPSPTMGPRNGTFDSDTYSWLTNDEVRDFILYAPSAWIAQQVFISERLQIFAG